MQRHERLQRVRAGFGERTDVLADQTALSDVDHLFSRRALLAFQLVFPRDAVEIVDDAPPQLRAVPRLEEELVEPYASAGGCL